VLLDRNEGAVKKQFFSAMLYSSVWRNRSHPIDTCTSTVTPDSCARAPHMSSSTVTLLRFMSRRSAFLNSRARIPVRRCTEAQKRHSLSPLFATLIRSLSRKSFLCHSYANTFAGCATPPKILPLSPALTTFRINTCISVASKQLYPPVESTLVKKRGKGEGGVSTVCDARSAPAGGRSESTMPPLCPGVAPT